MKDEDRLNNAAKKDAADAIFDPGIKYRALPAVVFSLQLVASALFLVSTPGAALAGYDEGAAAYGRGDYATAFEAFSAAAEQGNTFAQYKLGLMYYGGEGVPRNLAKSAKWYRKAAEQGLAPAQIVLGVLYSYGHGVPQDYIQAYMWSNLAAASGDEVEIAAIEARNNIAQKMTPSQVEKAQRLTREWLRNRKNF